MRSNVMLLGICLACAGYSRRVIEAVKPFQNSLHEAQSLAKMKHPLPLEAILTLLLSFNPAVAANGHTAKTSVSRSAVEHRWRYVPVPRMSLDLEVGKAFKAAGFNVGLQLEETFTGLSEEEVSMVLSGMKAALMKEAPEPQLRLYATKAVQILQERAEDRAKVLSEAGEKFLADAAAESGAVKTDSGLVIETLTEGSGASPKQTDTVEVHYEGKHVDGTIFDSSYQRRETISFPLGGVIPGWTEGLQLMKVGGKAKLTIPYSLGYGEAGSPPAIPPKSTLIFTVELISIK